MSVVDIGFENWKTGIIVQHVERGAGDSHVFYMKVSEL